MSSPDDSTSDLDFGPTLRGLAANQRVFDRYELREFLGRGGMGIVWRAYDEQLERDVALKFLPELLVHDRTAMDELKRETKRSLELTHHHIVRIYDFVQDGRIACISMEFVDGQTLSALRVEKGNKVFEVEDLKPLIEQACDALEYAHVRARIVHRDFKPTNLMLNSRGEVKVTDFGIARNLSDSVSTLSGRITGTVAYSSPQQLSGDPPSITDDVYSIGATLYELLTSKPPFYRGQIDRQIFNRIPPSIAVRRTELDIRSPSVVPVRWEETIAACLAKEPSDRPQGSAEILKRLGLLSSLRGHRPPFSIEIAETSHKSSPPIENQSWVRALEGVKRALLARRPILNLPVSVLVIGGTAAFAAVTFCRHNCGPRHAR